MRQSVTFRSVVDGRKHVIELDTEASDRQHEPEDAKRIHWISQVDTNQLHPAHNDTKWPRITGIVYSCISWQHIDPRFASEWRTYSNSLDFCIDQPMSFEGIESIDSHLAWWDLWSNKCIFHSINNVKAGTNDASEINRSGNVKIIQEICMLPVLHLVLVDFISLGFGKKWWNMLMWFLRAVRFSN